MNWNKQLSYKAYRYALKFYYDLYEELNYYKLQKNYLTPEEYKVLETYYRYFNMMSIEGLAKSDASWLYHIIEKILASSQTITVLDAGCGLGSHAIFFSLLGANVVGIDLNEQRINVARKRVNYYQNKYGRNLNVNFYLKNILKFCEPNKFDIVWCNQAISHIHPVENFVAISWKNLKEGGYLIISDSNGINPYVSFNSWLVHMKGGKYTLVKDPETKQLIPYARERMLSPLYLCNILKKTGFTIEKIEYHKFFPPHIYKLRFFQAVDEILAHVPLIRSIGITYIIISKKEI